MEQKSFDFSKEYGIVLEGGGAKGAYQIGVWKALMEYGVKIKAIAGVSVGALNGALICMGDYDRAVNLWSNISYSSIMNVDDDEMDKLMNRNFKDINFQTVGQRSKKLLSSGGIDVTPLKQLMEEVVDEKKIKESEIEFIIGTFNLSNMKEIEITAKETEDGCLKDYLMASASFPLFKSEKFNGKTYIDGGVANNVPIDMLINRGYEDIIVIRIFGVGMEKKIKIPENVNIVSIAPKTQLCNILEFNPKKAVRNISLGYFDTVRILMPLAGNEYYIDSLRNERDYLSSLIALPEEQLKEILITGWQDTVAAGYSITKKCVEDIFPKLAILLKLDRNWNYTNLYYGILEYCARRLRIAKYRIYTEQEFCSLLYKMMMAQHQEEENTDFIMEYALAIISNILA